MIDAPRNPGAAPPLQILVLFHPRSELAPQLARDIYRRFMVLGGGPGLRILVRFGAARPDGAPPVRPAFDDRTRTLVIALIDGRMARRALPDDRSIADVWGDLVHELIATITAQPGVHGILPVALDAGAFGLDKRLDDRSFVRLDVLRDPDARVRELEFQVAIAALQLVRHGNAVAEPQQRVPITLFVSHAKVDTPHEDGEVVSGPIEELLSYLAQNPIDGWFDRKRIPGGLRFDQAIEQGVIQSDVVVCVLTDRWSDREWCRREALYAKRSGRPIVVLDALSDRVERLFPYLGNAPMLRWKPGAAKTVVLAAMLEALRHCHARAVLARRKAPDDHVFGAHPESLTLRRVPATARRVLYPDPPLPREELDEILPAFAVGDDERIRPFELTTPLSELARWRRPGAADLVGLSLSGAGDIEAWGASADHLGTLADDLATMLLITGLRLGYGGTLEHGGASGDPINFAARLFGLVRSYSPLAQQLGSLRFHPILNFVAWPKHLGYGDRELAMYGQEAELVAVSRPPLPMTDEDLGKDGSGTIPRITATQRWAHARGLTAMREEMTRRICARVAVAGKLEGYKGLLPGVLEEILIARSGEHARPLYLLGAFGGAARLAIDLIEQRGRLEATTAWVTERVDGHAALVAEYTARGDAFATLEQAAATLRALGAHGPARALDNGLDDAQNRELFEATDSYRIVELLLTGLRNRFAG